MTFPNRLRREADEFENGWRPATALHRQGDHVEELRLRWESPQLRPLVTIPHEGRPEFETLEYEIALDLPAHLHGVALEGQPLEMQLLGLSAVSIWVDDRLVLDEPIPLIAAGPAKFTLVPEVHAGDNGKLRIIVRTGRGEVHGSMLRAIHWFHLGTPAMTEAFRFLDVAAAQLELAVALAEDDLERELVAAVANQIDALPGTLYEHFNEVRTIIESLAPILHRAGEYEVMCIGHSHVDLAWLWDWADARAVQRRDLQSIADIMDDYPEFRFTHSQAAAYRAVKEDDPALFARIRTFVDEGRLEPATMQWVESDTNIASGPATVRQLIEGSSWTVDELGLRPHVHLAPDTFGHAGNLPQLTTSAGADIYYHHRANPGVANGGQMWPAYWWEGDDGTRLLAISTPIYLGPLTAGRVVKDLIDAGIKRGRRTICFFYGVGDHGGGPTRDDLDFRRIMDSFDLFPRVTCRRVSEYRDAIIASGEELPVHKGESMSVFEGCYVSHSDGKQANRSGESILVTADALLAIAGEPEPQELAEAWRTVLFNQFHDIGGGSAISVVYDDVVEQLANVQAVAARTLAGALDVLEIGHSGDWLVTNPSPESVRTAVLLPTIPSGVSLLDGHGRVSATQETFDGQTVTVLELKPFETRGLRWSDKVAATNPFAISRSGDHPSYPGHDIISLESNTRLIQIRGDSGVMTTFLDKESNQEFLEFGEGRDRLAVQTRPDLGFGVLQVLDEHPHIMTAWLADEFYREESMIRGFTEVIEHGAVRTVLRTTHRIRNSTVVSNVEVYGDLDAVFIDLDIDWRELGNDREGLATLAIAFTARLSQVTARYETPFSSAERPADGRIVAGLRWAHLGNERAGFAVFNSGRYGHEALGSRIRVHLARGSYDPDALGDLGRHHVRIAVLPHVGDWRQASLMGTASALNTPPLVRESTHESGGQRELWRPELLGSPGVHLAEIKPGKMGGTIARVVEYHGADGHAELVVPAGMGVSEVSVIEELIRPVDVINGRIEIELGAHEVRTLLIR